MAHPYTGSAPPAVGAAVQVHRPGKPTHGTIGRFMEPGPDPAFAFVAVVKIEKQRTTQLPPADADSLRRQDKYPRKLFPFSQLLPYEPTPPL